MFKGRLTVVPVRSLLRVAAPLLQDQSPPLPFFSGPPEIFVIMWTLGWLARRRLRNFEDPVLPHPLVLCQELPHRVSVERWLYRAVELCKSRLKYASIHDNQCSVQLVLGTCLYVESSDPSFPAWKTLLHPDFPIGKTKQKRLCIRLALCAVGWNESSSRLGCEHDYWYWPPVERTQNHWEIVSKRAAAFTVDLGKDGEQLSGHRLNPLLPWNFCHQTH